MIIAFTGVAGSGKDTAAAHLCQRYGFTRVAFADPLREVGRTVFGLSYDEMTDRELKEKELDRWPFLSPRQILQTTGTEMFRTHFPGVWINAWLHRAKQHERVVVPDLRFPDEEESVRAHGGKIIVISAVGSSYQTRHTGHASEHQMIFPDAMVTNDFIDPRGRANMIDALDDLAGDWGIKPCHHCGSEWLPDAIR